MFYNRFQRISSLRCALLGTTLVALLAACDSDENTNVNLDDVETTSGAEVPGVGDETRPHGQLPDGIHPTAYRLLVTTDPADDSFSGSVEIDLKLDTPHRQIWLHSKDQNIQRAQIRLEDQTELTANVEHTEGDLISLSFAAAVPAGDVRLEIDYSAPYNLGLVGLYKTSQKQQPYLATQMEATDARRFVPSFDEPRFKTPWTITVRAPMGLRVVGNAPVTSSIATEDGWVEHSFAATREIPSYLLALAVGPYDMRDGGSLPANAVRSEPLALRGFSAAGKSSQLAEVMDITGEMLTWLEIYFDYPHPYAKLDLIAAPDFAYGAMENAGAIIYRESALLLNDRTSLGDRRWALTTHAHELGHQWFGNLVTPIWWDDIWLNEAFATWISYKTVDAIYPDEGFDFSTQIAAISAMESDRLLSARQIRNPILRDADIEDAFDSITYRKGGGVLGMFESYLGEDNFREGMRLHMRRYEDGVADVNDFMQSLADGSGDADVIESFRSFIFQPGIPYLDVALSCTTENTGVLTVSQSRYVPLGSQIDATASTWTIPFAARIGSLAESYEIRQMLSEPTTAIELENGCASWIMPNAGGSGYWRFTLDERAWSQLLANYDNLSGAEQLALVDSLTAAFAAGEINAATLLEGLALNAKGHWAAVADPLNNIPAYADALVAGDGGEQLRRFLTDSYGVRYEQLVNTNDEDLSDGDRLLKTALYATLVEYGQLEDERQSLADAAVAYIGVNGEPDAAVLSPDNLEIAMAIAARLGNEAFYQSAVDFALANENQRERRVILNTLAQYLPESQMLDLLERSFGDEFQGQETFSLFTAAVRNNEAQAAAWEKFQSDFSLVIARTPELRKSQATEAIAAFCDLEKIEEAVSFFEANQDLIPGYERPLAQAEETARLCAAFTAEKRQELAGALADR